ncbi:hypothetical protein [Burkholderia vietnamiensis]|uniref:hypothetical protein n=1 Tax=Burkholderia vietnamiensis TaxID=60552 RepID=UPI001CF2827D|nr:hypothetical protein [Burkholderia vietnamiensis]
MSISTQVIRDSLFVADWRIAQCNTGKKAQKIKCLQKVTERKNPYISSTSTTVPVFETVDKLCAAIVATVDAPCSNSTYFAVVCTEIEVCKRLQMQMAAARDASGISTRHERGDGAGLAKRCAFA